MEDIFTKSWEVPEGETVIITYIDGSQRAFDEYEWAAFKDGIKENLFDKELLLNIEFSWKNNT